MLLIAVSSFSMTSRVSVDLTSLRVRISDSASSRSLLCCFNLYNYVVVDAFIITAVNDCINPGNSRVSSDSLNYSFRFSSTSINMNDLVMTGGAVLLTAYTVSVIVFINKNEIPDVSLALFCYP